MISRQRGVEFIARAMDAVGLPMATSRWRPRTQMVAFAYHRVGDPAGSFLDHGLWSATADEFDRQVVFLRTAYDLIRPQEIDQARTSRGNFALITFDDGYRDNFEVAWPILNARRAVATWFVTTDFIDSRTLPWWDEIAWMVRTSRQDGLAASPHWGGPLRYDEPDRERTIRILLRRYKALSTQLAPQLLDAIAEASGSGRAPARVADGLWMSWAMLRELLARGAAVGGHTATHPVLSRCSAEQQEAEIAASGNAIRRNLQVPMTAMSYPVGGPGAFDSVTRTCLKRAHVEHAFSYYGGAVDLRRWDPFDLRRIPVERDVSMHRFRALTMSPRFFA